VRLEHQFGVALSVTPPRSLLVNVQQEFAYGRPRSDRLQPQTERGYGFPSRLPFVHPVRVEQSQFPIEKRPDLLELRGRVKRAIVPREVVVGARESPEQHVIVVKVIIDHEALLTDRPSSSATKAMGVNEVSEINIIPGGVLVSSASFVRHAAAHDLSDFDGIFRMRGHATSMGVL
jgi:hypothetical protein